MVKEELPVSLQNISHKPEDDRNWNCWNLEFKKIDGRTQQSNDGIVEGEVP